MGTTTKTYKPAVNGDDGMWLSSALFYNAITQAAFGNAAGVQYHMFIRFPAVDIPRGAVVTAAKLTFNAHLDQSGTTCSINIYCVAADNPAAPADLAACEALVYGTAAAWQPVAQTTDGNYDSASIIVPVQEIFNRAGWASGQALLAVLKNNASSTNAIRWVHTLEAGASIAPILTITYQELWENKINGATSPAKVYGLTNTAGAGQINKINTVSR
jgi:hypothetical protein